MRKAVHIVGVLVACLHICWSLPTFAQGVGASDNELYAGYCKGALDQVAQIDRVQTAAQRFVGYLMATGAMTDLNRRSAALGVSMAMTRGRVDQQRCNVTFAACSDAAFGKPGTPMPKENRLPQFSACLAQNSSCDRTAKCMQADGLPF